WARHAAAGPRCPQQARPRIRAPQKAQELELCTADPPPSPLLVVVVDEAEHQFHLLCFPQRPRLRCNPETWWTPERHCQDCPADHAYKESNIVGEGESCVSPPYRHTCLPVRGTA
ncbi:unnamed protein product, partial [Ectocarpus sp. 12 AP-2014]